MSTLQIEIQLIAVVVAAACALPGVFLVLRRMSLMSDAISHAILLGIVLAFFITQDLSSPLLIFGAAAIGVLTVTLVELIARTRLVKEDAAIGLVFPVLFSIGVILISKFAGNVHLDTDAVLLGELAFAPFDRFVLFGLDLGPRALYLMGGILLLNLLFIVIFYKELKLATFDAGLAAALGFVPVVIHYVLMGLVSITAVGAFDVVGSILVVALMIAPPATAYLLTDRLSRLIGLSVLIGALSAISGYWLARQRWEFAQTMLAIHLLNHEGTREAAHESRIEHMGEHMRWQWPFTQRVVHYAEQRGLLRNDDGVLSLTNKGRDLAQQAVVA
jgi:manganese/zinc/iron transport system permease protein